MRSTPEHANSALTYIVPDMSCGHCEATVTEAVAAVPAVRAAVAGAGYEAFRS